MKNDSEKKQALPANEAHSLTDAVRKEIQDKWIKVMMDSTYSLPETSEQVIAYLRDKESQHTSDFIIRRYIQNSYPGLLREAEARSGKSCVDLNENKNIAWEPDLNQALSECLYKNLSADISKKQWYEYLTAHKRLQRKQLFKVALTMGMDVGTTQKLLMACGKEPYNLHSVFDVICWYCQNRQEEDAYNNALKLYQEYEEKARQTGRLNQLSQEETNKKGIKPENGLPGKETAASGVTTVIGNLIDKTADDHVFLADLAKYSHEFTGYSAALWQAYRQFASYLAVLYPEYEYSYVDYKEKDPVTGEWVSQMDQKIVPVSMDAQGIPDMNQLLTAMFQDAFWFSGNKTHGKKEKHIAKVQKDVGGLIQTFCNNYKERCMKIVKKEASVDRQDILLFSFFFISNYLYLSALKRKAVKLYLKEIAKNSRKLKEGVKKVLDELDHDKNYKNEPFDTITRCLNYLLDSFDFTEVYLPNPFDRFIVLALLSDAPLAVTSVILDSIKGEREDGTLEK